MNVAQLTKVLDAHGGSSLHFKLPSGEFVPDHFHVTEVGRVEKNFIDCGGTRRKSVSCLLQTWTANDTHHRLTADKLAKILKLAAPILESDELSVEVEYGTEVAAQYTIADFQLADGITLTLRGKQTACLALDVCGVGQCNTDGCCP
jgi:hypothetical protein